MITHGKPPTIGPALERLEKVAREAGVELLLPDEEVEKHGVGEPESDLTSAEIAVIAAEPVLLDLFVREEQLHAALVGERLQALERSPDRLGLAVGDHGRPLDGLSGGAHAVASSIQRSSSSGISGFSLWTR